MASAVLFLALLLQASTASAPPDGVFEQAVSAQERGEFKTADQLYRQLLRDHPDALPVRVNLGSVLLAERQYSDAVAVLKPAEAANRDDLDIAWLLGNALLYADHPLDGLDRIERVGASGKADACLLAAETRLNLNQYDRALTQIEHALAIDGNLPGAHTLKGMILEHSGDYEHATSELQVALQRNGNDATAHLYLGAILFYKRHLPAARTHLEQAVKIDPASALALYQLALVKRAQGESESALKDLEDAERRNAQWLQPHIELASLYYSLKRPQDGLRERKLVDELSERSNSALAPAPSLAP